MLKLADLANRADFRLGSLRISPARRRVEGPGGVTHEEPVIMQVFLLLSDAAGEVVTRARLFDEVWGGVNVGDYSLNRAITMVRRMLSKTAPGEFEIENIPRTGYRLVGSSARDTAPLAGAKRKALVWTILLALFAAMLIAGFVLRNSTKPSGEARPLLIAVLPFEKQGISDPYLAQALWDDTRSAISRVGALRVLGRSTTTTAGPRGLSPEDYRNRFGVDYVLEATVRGEGGRVAVAVSLTRTSDGVAVWEDLLSAPRSDPVALQQAIARGIEGRLRGRLAPGGGRRASDIPTSPEVYALYSEARALLWEREPEQSRRAEALLRRAVALDPNFAPAWSSLALAIYHRSPGPIYDDSDRAEIVDAVRKAIMIAPNLAEAHATLANVATDDRDLAEQELRRAVLLDPSYAEAWNWLGNVLHDTYRYRDAIEAYERAIAIDPLWIPPVPNLVWSANEIGDRAAIDRLWKGLRRAGASNEQIQAASAEDMLDRGDYSGAIHVLRTLGKDATGKPVSAAIPGIFDNLTLLGYDELAGRLAGMPEWYAPMTRGERLPPANLDERPLTPSEFWSTIYFTPYAMRAMVNLGEEAELIRFYRGAFPSADDFLSGGNKSVSVVNLAPTLAVALRARGQSAEATYILASASRIAEKGTRTSPESRQPFADLALIRAAQGEREQALQLLSRAMQRGWLPDGMRQARDIAQEPAYRELRADPRFQAIRNRISQHIRKERAELGTVGL